MNELNKISIKQYLVGMNIHPVKDYGYYGMYHCPFRSDNNASFKLDYNKNVWYDFGTNAGGTMIDFVMKLENCTFKEAVTHLESKSTDMQISKPANILLSPNRNEQTITIQYIIPIMHPKLIEWVEQRKIDLALAKKYCKEIHYQNQSGQFFSVGFRNDRGGFELSSPTGFKGCYPPKDVRTCRNGKDSCLVFEGFWDFLSYLTIQKIEKTKHDVVVLNSVANVQRAMCFLKKHQAIYTYLDNDDAGRKTTELIKSACLSVHDRSERYAEFKDLNDYLRQKPIVKPEVKKKKLGIRR
jgi:DNA primase